MFHDIKDGAIFISDVHYNKKRVEFKYLLEKFLSNPPVQLFLVGDIFDFLTTNIDYFKNINKEVIDLLNELSLICEIFYFEGNHDFNIDLLFPNITIFDYNHQPVIFNYYNKKIAISHGDRFEGSKYQLYVKLIRNNIVLKFINFIDFQQIISKYVEKKLMDKKICNKYNFDKSNRIKFYNKDIDLVIEGHFHIGLISDDYINIPAFACGNKYIRFDKNIKVLDAIR